MAWIANKNLVHNGKEYAKGSEVKESSEGFAELKKAGHLSEGSAPAKAAAPEPESEAAPEKSKGKGK